MMLVDDVELEVELSRKMREVFTPDVRFRVAYGGRAGQKSYGFADMALVRMVEKRTDIAVCREYDSTIKDSVHKLLQERISYHKIDDMFHVTNNDITYRPNGSKIIYQHLHNNFDEVRGLEGTDVCWIFEGHDLQRESWSVLNPTIRRTPRMEQDPEIWIEFNPQHEDDFVYEEFVVKTGNDRIAVLTNYIDHDWCPESTIAEAERCKRENPDEYEHIWLGAPRNIGGLVYPMFDIEHHIRDVDITRIERAANFFMAQDPHTAYYPACIWFARMPRGDGQHDYYIYNEWPTRATFGGRLYHELRSEKKCALTLLQRAKVFKLVDNTLDKTYHAINIMARGIDTRFAKGAGSASTTSNTRGIIVEMADERNGGLVFETPPEYMIDAQRDRIRELLYWDKLTALNAFNEPRLYVMSHCENVIDTLRFHRWAVKRNRNSKEYEKEDDKRKDFGDALKIGLAVEQQHAHVDRFKASSAESEATEPSRVDMLEEAFLGKPASRQTRMTPTCS